jgi:hypothetical protein
MEDRRAAIALELDNMRRGAAEARLFLQAYENAAAALGSADQGLEERPAMVASAVAKAERGLQPLGQQPVVLLLHELKEECLSRAREAAHESVKLLGPALEQNGVTPDAGSRHPKYGVDRGLITVTVDERKLEGRVQTRHGSALVVPLDVGGVVAAVLQERDRLLSRPWDESSFLKSLLRSFQSWSKKNAGPIPLRTLAQAMAGRKPKLDEFAVDLGRLLTGEAIRSAEPPLRANHTRDEKAGLHLYGLESGGMVGSLSRGERVA